jgi:hypothetical protein
MVRKGNSGTHFSTLEKSFDEVEVADYIFPLINSRAQPNATET